MVVCLWSGDYFAAMQTPAYTVDPALARLLRVSFAKELYRSIYWYLTRYGMSPWAFGLAAVNDAGFVRKRLKKGKRIQLDTADKLRRFMGLQMFRPVLLWEVKVFLEFVKLKAWVVGDWSIHQRAFIGRLYAGASPLLMTVDRFRRWMHAQLRPEERRELFAAVARELAAAPDTAAPGGAAPGGAAQDTAAPPGDDRAGTQKDRKEEIE